MPRKIPGVDPALDEPQRNIFHSEVEALQVRAQRGASQISALAGPLFRGTSAIPFTLSVISGRAQRYLAQPKNADPSNCTSRLPLTLDPMPAAAYARS